MAKVAGYNAKQQGREGRSQNMDIFDKDFSPIGIAAGAVDVVAKAGGAVAKSAVDVVCGIGGTVADIGNQIQRNINRPKTPFSFEDGISQEEFAQMADAAAKTIKRVVSCRCDGPIARFTVRSQSNISEWGFSVDFNAWGHFTGQYWIKSDNADSKIPGAIAERMSESIKARIA